MTLWKMPTSIAEASPPFELAGEDSSSKLLRVGPTLHGWIFRSATGTAFCHVLPVEAPPLVWKQEVRKRAAAVADGRASRIVNNVINPYKAGQGSTGDYYFIHYDPGEPAQSMADLLNGRTERPIFSERIIQSIFDRLCELGRLGEELNSLPQLLAGNSAGLRVMAIALVFQTIARWWQQGVPLLPMPSQILFNADGEPLFLGGTPYLPITRVEQLFSEPQRILYLAPELIGSRGSVAWDWQRVDYYCLGVLLHQCLYPPSAIPNPETALRRAVNGTLFNSDSRRGTTPFWLSRMPALKQANEWVRRLTAINPAMRTAVNLRQVGSVLEVCGQRLTPFIAVRELIDSETPYAGLELLQDVLLTEESYEYQVLAAQTATAVERPLESLDLFTRAISRNGARSEARLERIWLLSRAPEFAALSNLYDKESPRLDALIWDDFNSLDTETQFKARLPLANYLVWRGQYLLAAQHIYHWLFDSDGQYRRYDMEMNRTYAWALHGLAWQAIRSADDDAAEHVKALREQLNTWQESMITLRIRDGKDPGEHYEYGESLNEMAVAVYEMEQILTKATERPPTEPGKTEEPL